jgi:hypothetical protein
VAFISIVAFDASCARTHPGDKVTNAASSINALKLLIFIPQTMLFSKKNINLSKKSFVLVMRKSIGRENLPKPPPNRTELQSSLPKL